MIVSGGRQRLSPGRHETERIPRPRILELAWLLHLSPAVLPIPGAAAIAELEENVLAAALELPDGIVAELSAGAALS